FTPLPGYFSPFPHGTIRYRSSGSIEAYHVVVADSHEISRAPGYLGHPINEDLAISTTGLSPTTVNHSRSCAYHTDAITPLSPGRMRQSGPTTPHTQRLPSLNTHAV